MGWLDFFIGLFFLVLTFLVGAFGYVYLFSDPVVYQSFSINASAEGPTEYQFYPNMRYADKLITYSIEPSCDLKRTRNVHLAFDILDDKTVLDFREVLDGQIKILCSEDAPEPENKGHYVAGEGGPTEIINTGRFYVIGGGQVSLYRSDNCETPQIAIHEILHSLGFDHVSNEESIMYPITSCDQKIDEGIINKIEKVYSYASLPDLEIESAKLSQEGRFLSFEVDVRNSGLAKAESAYLEIIADEKILKKYDLEDFDVGIKRKLSVENLKTLLNYDQVEFRVTYSGEELSKANNNIILEASDKS